MAYSRSEANAVADALYRSVRIDQKIERVSAANRLDIDENDDLAVSNAAQVAGYIAALTNRRDNIVAAIKPVVAGW